MRLSRTTGGLAALAAVFATAPGAHALTLPAATIDGPSADIVSLGGVAMAQDGSGGLVYRKRIGTRTHIFVSRLFDAAWQPPVRVDSGQEFDSSWPQIGAGKGGRLVVTWVQEFGSNSDRMFSATLDPGASRFQAPIPLDLNVGEAVATYPSLSMNSAGAAYLAYRVTQGDGRDPTFPPGYIASDVRLARYNGALWSTFGSVVDRNSAAPVRTPDAGNSPRVATDQRGNAIVAFHEPDDDFVDRIWARRVFGTTLGIPLLVSPQKIGETPLRGEADAFALDSALFGEGVIAFRQRPGPASPLKGTRIMSARIPAREAAFKTAEFADGVGPDAAPVGALGMPAVGVTPLGSVLTAFGAGSVTSLVPGGETPGPLQRLDDGTSTVPGDPVLELAPDGAEATAWEVQTGARGGIAVRERTAGGVVTVGTASGSAGGAIATLLSGGSGLGDAALAFLQGEGAGIQIAGAVVDAAPAAFLALVPAEPLREQKLKLRWVASENALSALTYTVSVDDEAVAEGVRGTSVVLGPNELPDGTSEIKVIAGDRNGQQTESAASELVVDRAKPRVRARTRGRSVTVTIGDGERSASSGLVRSALRVSFGDGAKASRKATARHRYPRAGTYRVRVTARDEAGNRLRRTLKVKVR